MTAEVHTAKDAPFLVLRDKFAFSSLLWLLLSVFLSCSVTLEPLRSCSLFYVAFVLHTAMQKCLETGQLHKVGVDYFPQKPSDFFVLFVLSRGLVLLLCTTVAFLNGETVPTKINCLELKESDERLFGEGKAINLKLSETIAAPRHGYGDVQI